MNNPDAEQPLVDASDIESAEPEWLVTNGLGGYASGTVSGKITRRFHGWLIAALPAPYGRMMMLNKLTESVHMEGTARYRLSTPSGQDSSPTGILTGASLVSFRLEDGLPVWTYSVGGARLERRVMMVHDQNTTYIVYRLLHGTAPLELELEPWLNLRPHEGAVDVRPAEPYSVTIAGTRFEIGGPGLPSVRLRLSGKKASFTLENDRVKHVRYPVEDSRGYDNAGDLRSTGFFRVTLEQGDTASLLATAEPWEIIDRLPPEEAFASERVRRARLIERAGARGEITRALVYAADQFLITPVGRVADAAWARARGDDVRTLIAGYPWFTDWGRDTMISLEGIALVTGRHEEARYILRTFAHFVRDGLIPNMFPEGKNAGLYHTADATLWFFHAIDRYLAHTRDHAMLDQLLPTLLDIAAWHERGTQFGIGVDTKDGLLRQGAPGYQLTWMDAKVGDLVVTPRRGKAVEINALYYNALRLLERWTSERDAAKSAAFAESAERLKASFNARFWNEGGAYLNDVVDREGGGDDPSFRPNQLLAISLPHPVLTPDRWASVVSQVAEKLVTPMGLRSLAPEDAEYKPKYFGDLRARDLAYHQGTVWSWLIGPFIDAWMRVHPHDEERARGFLAGFPASMNHGCVGTIGEIFDGNAPFVGRGCVAQAWSVAEVLRCVAKVSGKTP